MFDNGASSLHTLDDDGESERRYTVGVPMQSISWVCTRVGRLCKLAAATPLEVKMSLLAKRRNCFFFLESNFILSTLNTHTLTGD